jgi:hypothetical protein
LSTGTPLPFFTNILLTDNSTGALNGKIKKVIDQLKSWFNDNQLLINTDKMKALFFHGNRLVSQYRPVQTNWQIISMIIS